MTYRDARSGEATTMTNPTRDGLVRLPLRADLAVTDNGFMSIAEVAAYLGLSQRWVYEQVRVGRLPARLIARSWRLRRDEVDSFADSFMWTPDEEIPTVTMAVSGRVGR